MSDNTKAVLVVVAMMACIFVFVGGYRTDKVEDNSYEYNELWEKYNDLSNNAMVTNLAIDDCLANTEDYSYTYEEFYCVDEARSSIVNER